MNVGEEDHFGPPPFGQKASWRMSFLMFLRSAAVVMGIKIGFLVALILLAVRYLVGR